MDEIHIVVVSNAAYHTSIHIPIDTRRSATVSAYDAIPIANGESFTASGETVYRTGSRSRERIRTLYIKGSAAGAYARATVSAFCFDY